MLSVHGSSGLNVKPIIGSCEPTRESGEVNSANRKAVLVSNYTIQLIKDS